jgi:hypothetical protein
MTRGEAPVQKAEPNFRRRGPSRSRSCSVPTRIPAGARAELLKALTILASTRSFAPGETHIVIRKPQIWKSPASRVSLSACENENGREIAPAAARLGQINVAKKRCAALFANTMRMVCTILFYLLFSGQRRQSHQNPIFAIHFASMVTGKPSPYPAATVFSSWPRIAHRTSCGQPAARNRSCAR